MGNKKVKWLIYTVCVGLIPIISRFFIWLVTKDETIKLFSPSDFISFGLILHISNINEIEHITSQNLSWKTIQNGISIMFIAFYSVLFALTIISEGTGSIININIINICVISLALVSFFISYSIYDRLSYSETNKINK